MYHFQDFNHHQFGILSWNQADYYQKNIYICFLHHKKTDYDNFDISPYHNKFVKLVVVNKKNNEMFDRLLERLYHKITVHELKILEDYSDLNANLVSDDVVEGTEDTMTLVNNYVDQLKYLSGILFLQS